MSIVNSKKNFTCVSIILLLYGNVFISRKSCKTSETTGKN